LVLISVAEIQITNAEQRSNVGALRAEIARLQSENVQLKSENTQLKSENAQLKSENVGVKSKILLSDSEKPHEKPSGGSAPYSKLISTFLRGGDYARLALVHLEEQDDEIDLVDLGSTKSRRRKSNGSKKPSEDTWHSPKNCPGHCNQNCWIETEFLSSKCGLLKDGISRAVVFVGTSTVPKWNIMHGKGCVDTRCKLQKTVRGTVQCPCHVDGARMTYEEAVRSIAGQVSAMGIPADVAEAALGQHGDAERQQAVFWNVKIAFSVVKMLKCWVAKCAARGSKSANVFNELEYGGGTEC
jgi:hypothetical protein